MVYLFSVLLLVQKDAPFLSPTSYTRNSYNLFIETENDLAMVIDQSTSTINDVGLAGGG